MQWSEGVFATVNNTGVEKQLVESYREDRDYCIRSIMYLVRSKARPNTKRRVHEA